MSSPSLTSLPSFSFSFSPCTVASITTVRNQVGVKLPVGQVDDLWFEVSAQRLDEHLKHNGTVDDFLRQLLERDVIRQHDRVTRDQRGHWNALWFQWHDDKLVWQRDYRPTWRSSKMANCLNILADLRLVEADDLNTKVSQS